MGATNETIGLKDVKHAQTTYLLVNRLPITPFYTQLVFQRMFLSGNILQSTDTIPDSCVYKAAHQSVKSLMM